MANELAVLGAVPSHLAHLPVDKALGAGVQASFGSLTYKGKQWAIRHRGETTTIMRSDGSGPIFELELVIVKASPTITKIFYANAYKEGSDEPPDCFSVDGVKPDTGAKAPQNATCAGCAHNVWGSKTSENGSKGKACSDGKRLAVVPAGDMKNERFGGPMLLRVPPASLQSMSSYAAQCEAAGTGYYALVTAVSFDPQVAYPHLVFTGKRYLDEAQTKVMLDWQNGPQVQRILSEPVDAVKAEPGVPGAPGVPSEPVKTSGQINPTEADLAAKVAAHVAAEHARAVAEREAVKPNPFAPKAPETQPQPQATVTTPPTPPGQPEYTVSPDGKMRWKPGMAQWELIPQPTPPPAPPAPPVPSVPPVYTPPPVNSGGAADPLAIPAHLDQRKTAGVVVGSAFGGGPVTDVDHTIVEPTKPVTAPVATLSPAQVSGVAPLVPPAASPADQDPDYVEFLRQKAEKAAKKTRKARVAAPSPTPVDTNAPPPIPAGPFGDGGTAPQTAPPLPVSVPADPALTAQPGAGSASVADVDRELEALLGR